jgi:hypothetical protein
MTRNACLQFFRLSLGAGVLCALAACGSGGQSANASGPTGGSGSGSGSGGGGTGVTGSATVTWVAPTQNADGSALTNLAGFHVYYGADANTLSTMQDVPQSDAASVVVANLNSGTYYFAVSAYTTDGTESELSAAVSKIIG